AAAMLRILNGMTCPSLLRAPSVSGFFANANSSSADSARRALRGGLPVNSGDVWILFGQPIKQARRQLILCEPQSDGFVMITVLNSFKGKTNGKPNAYGKHTCLFLGNCFPRNSEQSSGQRSEQNRIQVPVQSRSLRSHQPRLVAQSSRPTGSPPALQPLQ